MSKGLKKSGSFNFAARLRPGPSFGVRLIAGLLAVTAAGVSRLLLTPLLGARVPYATFYAAILFASLFGGYVVALICLVLAALFVIIWINPFFSEDEIESVELTGFLLFLCVGGIIIWLGERVRRANEAVAAANQKNMTILESISDAFYTVNHDWRFIYVNAQAEKYLERSREELLGQNLWEKFPTAVGSVFEENYRRAVNENRALSFESVSTFSKRWLEVNIYPSAEGLSVYFRDITERKNAEREKEELLQKEKQARIEAEAANRFKDEFLATVSHELRTPLNAILGWAKIAEADGLRGDKAERALEIISRNADRQKQIIDDLLDVSRIITGKIRLNLQTVDLVAVIKDSIETFAPAVEAKHITLTTSFGAEKITLPGDSDRLHQIFWNLLSNAVKFTPAGGEINVSAVLENEQVRVIFSDTGEGIQPEFLPFVFERFRQQDGGASRRFGGLGLGLAIVRNLTEIHGGSVHVASDGAGRGTTFAVAFPLPDETVGYAENAAKNLDKAASRNARVLSGVCALIVEDEPDAAELIKIILNDAGAETVLAASAADALEKFRAEMPDVVISDIGMPFEDGYSLIKKIRAVNPHVPAIALTAYNAQSDRERALAEGFNVHLAKPLEPEKLISAVNSLLDRNH